jgi:hypothetical protein
MLLVCVLACGHAVTPAPSPVSVILAGPTIAADSLHVAATDSFGVGLARRLARDTSVHVAVVSDRGALDFIDGGGDVLVTDRPSVIRYASSRSDFATMALPWDRQYALLTRNLAPPRTPDVLDAVHADARVAQQHCPTDTVSVRTPSDVYYVAEDSIARSLAERLVGLGVARRAMPFSRALLTLAPLAELSIATRPIAGEPCDRDWQWWHAGPLIDTRSHLIVRRGAVGVVPDTAGGVTLETTP